MTMNLPSSRSSRSLVWVLLALVIVLIIIGGVWYALSTTKYDTNFDEFLAMTPLTTPTPSPLPSPTVAPPSPTPAITSAADIQAAITQVDSTDIDSLDTDLRALEAEAAQF